MKYLCLIYTDEKTVSAMSRDEVGAILDECLAYDEALRKSGHYIASEKLQPIDATTTLRVRNGRVGVTDGPFAETKEQLGGFYLINARDLNEAIRIASKIPPGRLGTIEIRPVEDLARAADRPASAAMSTT